MTKGAAPGKSDRSAAQVETTVAERVGEAGPEDRPLALKVLPEVLLLAVSIYLFIDAFGFEYVAREGRLAPSFWPQVICVGIGVCSLVSIAQKVRARGRPVAQNAPIEIEGMPEAEEDHPVRWSRLITAIALVVAYPAGAIILGYPIATALLLIAFMYLGGQRRWYVIPLGVFGSLLFTYVFGKVVYVAVPTGLGFFDQLTVILYQLLGIY